MFTAANGIWHHKISKPLIRLFLLVALIENAKQISPRSIPKVARNGSRIKRGMGTGEKTEPDGRKPSLSLGGTYIFQYCGMIKLIERTN